MGRLVGFGGVTASIAAIAELGFLPALTIVLSIPLILSRSRRDYQLLAVLPLLWLCDVHHHLRASGLVPQSHLRSDLVAVDLVVVVMIIITGRIVPLFTRNALDDERVRAMPALNIAATVVAGLVVAAEVVAPSSIFMAVVATAAHPGWTGTDLQRHSGFMRFLNLFFAQTPPMGGLPSLRAATDLEAEGGDYFGPKGIYEMRGYPVRVDTTSAAKNELDAIRLWEVSEKLTGVPFLGGDSNAV